MLAHPQLTLEQGLTDVMEHGETYDGQVSFTHVKFHPLDDPLYIPLHVGRSGKEDLGYLGDDTGENISDLNFLYGELTGLF